MKEDFDSLGNKKNRSTKIIEDLSKNKTGKNTAIHQISIQENYSKREPYKNDIYDSLRSVQVSSEEEFGNLLLNLILNKIFVKTIDLSKIDLTIEDYHNLCKAALENTENGYIKFKEVLCHSSSEIKDEEVHNNNQIRK